MKKSFLYLGLFSLIIRALYFSQLSGTPLVAKPLLDQRYYDLCARQLAGYGGDLIDGFRPILYPMLISILYRLDADGGMILSLLMQHILGILITLLVAMTATTLFKNTKAGMTAGLLYALSAPPLYFEGKLLITTLFSFLLLLLTTLTLRALEGSRQSRSDVTDINPFISWFLCGIILGMAAQCRPNALPLILFFPLLTALRLFSFRKERGRLRPVTHTKAPSDSSDSTQAPPTRRPYSEKRIALTPLMAIPGLLVIQIIFGGINAKYSGNFSLITQAGGINFYLGNSKTADGMIPRQRHHVTYSDEYRDSVQVNAEQIFRKETGTYGPIPTDAVSDFWVTKTKDEIRQAPSRWLYLMLKKTWLMLCWNHEVPNNQSFEYAATHDTPLLQWLPVRWWLLLILFPWGIAALCKQQYKERLLWIFTFLVIYSGTVILFFVNSRFRIPLWPMMAVIAGGGIQQIYLSLKSRTMQYTPAVLSLLLLPLSLGNWFEIPEENYENDLSMRANAYYERGEYALALDHINRCLEIIQNNPRYYFIRGNILLAAQQAEESIPNYIKAISIEASDPSFHNNLGVAFEESGDMKRAETAYRNALKIQPDYKSAAENLKLLDKATEQ